MNSTYHHGNLKAALLAHAISQLEQNGLASISMREMAKAIDVSHTAAYRHFTDKHALLAGVATKGFEDMLKACLQATETAPAFPRARLQACGMEYIRFGLEKPKLLNHMFVAIDQNNASQPLLEAASQLFNLLQNLIETGQREGGFRRGNVQELSYACWSMVHGLATLLSISQQKSNPDINAQMVCAEKSLTIFLDGMEYTGNPSPPPSDST